MIKITNEIRREVLDYLECEADIFTDELYAFYYRCMKADMHFADADRYAILNTLFNYDIGMENAIAIDGWMYEHDKEIYELKATNKKDKADVKLAVIELGLNLDFSNWAKEDYTEYKYFEETIKDINGENDMKQYVLVYVNKNGDTIARDYFDNLEKANSFMDDIIETYKYYNEDKGLILYNDNRELIRYYEPNEYNIDEEDDDEYIIKVVCPHCGHEFELNRLCHDEINLEGFYTGCMECGGSFDIDFDMGLVFITDIPKMADFKILTKEEFLSSYSYLTEEEYEATRLYYNWLMADDREP